jgi:hypothetical protein
MIHVRASVVIILNVDVDVTNIANILMIVVTTMKNYVLRQPQQQLHQHVEDIVVQEAIVNVGATNYAICSITVAQTLKKFVSTQQPKNLK